MLTYSSSSVLSKHFSLIFWLENSKGEAIDELFKLDETNKELFEYLFFAKSLKYIKTYFI